MINYYIKYKLNLEKFLDMLNQLRFEQNDFRKYVIRFHNVVNEKNNVINILYESKLMIEQTNNVARNYQKRITKL